MILNCVAETACRNKMAWRGVVCLKRGHRALALIIIRYTRQRVEDGIIIYIYILLSRRRIIYIYILQRNPFADAPPV